MADVLGSLVYDLSLNSGNLEGALAAAESKVKVFGSGVNNYLSSVGEQAKKTFNAFADLGDQMIRYGALAAGAVAAVGIKTAADLETARAGFITLTGSAEEADRILAMIKKDAAKTPFEIKGLTQANQLLTSVTKNGNTSERLLLNVGKALAAMGKGQPELDRIIVNLQQIGATGRATMMDVRQFAFAGIPIFEMLSQTTGKYGQDLEDLISNGGVTFDLLQQLFNNAGEGSGRFAQAFETQAGTMTQLFSNLKDTFAITAADIMVKSGAFDTAKEAIGRLTKWVDEHKEDLIKFAKDGMQKAADAAEKLANVVKGIYEWYNSLSPKQKELTNKVLEFLVALPLAAAALRSITKTLAPFLELSKLLVKVLAPVLDIIGVGLINALYGVAAALGISVGWVLAIIAAIVAVGVIIFIFRDQIWNFFTKTIPQAIGVAVKWFQDMLGKVGGFFVGIGNWFLSLPGVIGGAIMGAINWLAQLPERIAFFLGFIVGRFIRFIVVDLPNFITGFVTGLVNFVTVELPKWINGVVDWFSKLPGRIAGFLSNVVTAIGDWFGKAWDKATKIASDIVNAVGGFFAKLPERIAGIVDSIVNFFKDLPRRIIDGLANLGNMLYDKLKSIAGAAWDGFKKGLGIKSPSYIEKAFKAIKKEGADTVDKMYSTVGKLNSMKAPSVGSLAGSIRNTNSTSNINIYGNINANSQTDSDAFLRRLNRNQQAAMRGATV